MSEVLTPEQKREFRAFIIRRNLQHAQAKMADIAWRQAGRPVWQSSDDGLTSERIFLDAKDAM